jgi:rRNA-processing protein FCF1
MIVVFDTCMIGLSISPHIAIAPNDPATGQPLINAKARVDALIKHLTEKKAKVIIPAPVFAELLVKDMQNVQQVINRLNLSSALSVEAFDERAAIELACINRDIYAKHGKYKCNDIEIKAKISFDRQIIAIAKVHHADTIYTGDNGIKTKAEELGIKTVCLAELPEPLVKEQIPMEFEVPKLVSVNE